MRYGEYYEEEPGQEQVDFEQEEINDAYPTTGNDSEASSTIGSDATGYGNESPHDYIDLTSDAFCHVIMTRQKDGERVHVVCGNHRDSCLRAGHAAKQNIAQKQGLPRFYVKLPGSRGTCDGRLDRFQMTHAEGLQMLQDSRDEMEVIAQVLGEVTIEDEDADEVESVTDLGGQSKTTFVATTPQVTNTNLFNRVTNYVMGSGRAGGPRRKTTAPFPGRTHPSSPAGSGTTSETVLGNVTRQGGTPPALGTNRRLRYDRNTRKMVSMEVNEPRRQSNPSGYTHNESIPVEGTNFPPVVQMNPRTLSTGPNLTIQGRNTPSGAQIRTGTQAPSSYSPRGNIPVAGSTFPLMVPTAPRDESSIGSLPGLVRDDYVSTIQGGNVPSGGQNRTGTRVPSSYSQPGYIPVQGSTFPSSVPTNPRALSSVGGPRRSSSTLPGFVSDRYVPGNLEAGQQGMDNPNSKIATFLRKGDASRASRESDSNPNVGPGNAWLGLEDPAIGTRIFIDDDDEQSVSARRRGYVVKRKFGTIEKARQWISEFVPTTSYEPSRPIRREHPDELNPIGSQSLRQTQMLQVHHQGGVNPTAQVWAGRQGNRSQGNRDHDAGRFEPVVHDLSGLSGDAPNSDDEDFPAEFYQAPLPPQRRNPARTKKDQRSWFCVERGRNKERAITNRLKTLRNLQIDRFELRQVYNTKEEALHWLNAIPVTAAPVVEVDSDESSDEIQFSGSRKKKVTHVHTPAPDVAKAPSVAPVSAPVIADPAAAPARG